jgi:hypothetical protein
MGRKRRGNLMSPDHMSAEDEIVRWAHQERSRLMNDIDLIERGVLVTHQSLGKHHINTSKVELADKRKRVAELDAMIERRKTPPTTGSAKGRR